MRQFIKRCTFVPGLLLMVLVLVRCGGREVDFAPESPAGEAPFAVFAPAEGTRTENDGLSTRWVSGDRFTLYHKVSGADSFLLDGAFTVDDPATGHAVGTVSGVGNGQYDWAVVYPYAAASGSDPVPVTVGCVHNGTQVQSAYDAMDHLAGAYFPLYGLAEELDGQAVPAVPVRQLAAVVAIRVTNSLPTPILVTDVTLEASVPLVGTFNINLHEGTGTLTPRTGEVSSSASLSVSAPTALAQGETAVLYLGIRPVSLPSGSTLTMTVNAQNGDGLPASETRSTTLSQEVDILAGHIRRLAFAFSGTFEEPEEGTYIFSSVTSVTPGRRYLLVFQTEDGPVMLLSRKGSEMQLEVEPVNIDGNSIKVTSLDNAFTIAEAINSSTGAVYEGYYTIRQEDADYVGVNTTQTSRNLAFASGATSNQYRWKLTMSGNIATFVSRSKTLEFFADSKKVGAYTGDADYLPRLYRLVNEEETAEALLEKTEYGAYGLPDWIYSAGTMQLSLLSASQGTVSFRIFEPSAKNVTQVAGIPTEMAVDDTFTVDVLRYERGKVKLNKPFVVRVLKVEGSKAWLVSPTGAGFIVKFQ